MTVHLQAVNLMFVSGQPHAVRAELLASTVRAPNNATCDADLVVALQATSVDHSLRLAHLSALHHVHHVALAHPPRLLVGGQIDSTI